MSLQDRLNKLEARLMGESDEQYFHRLCEGEYIHSLSLLENLQRAELPPGTTPANAITETIKD
ncbi:MAG TPA: hypothetical protein VGG19_20650 [Tepidisphaeraceae bacterium]|jgi:hypothetical protein